VALLRAVNVGGRNTIAMAALRSAFEDAGYDEVRTYIQSGNVLFRSSGRVDEARLEAELEERLGTPLVVVLRTGSQLRAVVRQAPPGFGSQPGTYHSDVLYLKAPLTSRQAMTAVELREDVDHAWPGQGVVYFARLSARRTQSRLSRIVGKPEYQQLTIRSWSTTTRLVSLLDGRP
jgi:uncharacterized protein (DUF1697 family)